MEDDHQREIAINGPSSLTLSPTITSPSSRKRLLSDLKPKQPIPISPFSDQFSKKTRDAPNLSNCHGCKLRINHSNPKERLQPLYSLWRILLLCKKCFKLVESGEICSYCFDSTCSEVCFSCMNCKRYVHKDCAVKFSRFPPWSYCRFESRFSYCVDCCEPKLLVKSTRVYIRRKSRISSSCSRDDTNGETDEADLHESTVCEKLKVCSNGSVNGKIDKRDSSGDFRVCGKKSMNASLEENSAVRMVSKKDENRGFCGSDDLTNHDSNFLRESSDSLRVSDRDSSAVFGKMQSKTIKGQESERNIHSICDRYFLKYWKKTGGNKGIAGGRSFNKNQDRYFLKYKKRRMKYKAESKTETDLCGDSLHLEDKDSKSTQGKCEDRYFLKYSKKSLSSKKPFHS